MKVDATLREQLQHVFWIGGGSAAGKSTIARRVAVEHGLRLYASDDVMAEHARRGRPEDSPFLSEFLAMTMDQRWVSRSPDTMLETFHWFRGEGFDLIVEDLLGFPNEPGVVVEGFRLLPHLVRPLVAVPGHAVWLLPTPEFRRSASEGRESWDFLQQTSDPAQARRNLLERDRLFTDRLREETTRLKLPAIDVDIATTADELAARVTEAFGL